jgi:hypothetical protein
MPKPTTLRSVTRTLLRLKHATKLGPDVLAYCLVKNYSAKPALEHLAFILWSSVTLRPSPSLALNLINSRAGT